MLEYNKEELCNDKDKEELYNDKEVCDKLKEVGLLDVVAKMISSPSFISIDFNDIKCVLKDKTIINSFYNKLNINDKINFNFTKCDDSKAIIIVECGINSIIYKIVNFLSIVRNSIGKVDISYGIYVDDELKKNEVNLLVIITK